MSMAFNNIPPCAMRYPVIKNNGVLPTLVDTERQNKWRVLMKAREHFAQEVHRGVLIQELSESKFYDLMDEVRAGKYDKQVIACLNAGPDKGRRYNFRDCEGTPFSEVLTMPKKVYLAEPFLIETQEYPQGLQGPPVCLLGSHWELGHDSVREAPGEEDLKELSRKDSGKFATGALIPTPSGLLMPCPSFHPLPVVLPRRTMSTPGEGRDATNTPWPEMNIGSRRYQIKNGKCNEIP